MLFLLAAQDPVPAVDNSPYFFGFLGVAAALIFASKSPLIFPFLIEKILVLLMVLLRVVLVSAVWVSSSQN